VARIERESPADQVARVSLSGKRGDPLGQAIREVEEMRKDDDWSRAEPRHLLGLYAWLHKEVYSVDPDELRKPQEWAHAVRAVENFLKVVGTVQVAVDFLRWTWAREQGREGKRKTWPADSPFAREANRIGWRLQFSTGSMLTDYRVARTRGQARNGHGR